MNILAVVSLSALLAGLFGSPAPTSKPTATHKAPKTVVASPTTAAATTEYEVPLASVTVPAECEGMTFDHAFVAGDRQIVEGTESNDLIFVGNGGIARGNGGDDCLVGGSRASMYGGDGNDVLKSGGSNSLKGNAGNDTFYAAGQDSIDGHDGNDTAYYHPSSDSVKNVETKIAI